MIRERNNTSPFGASAALSAQLFKLFDVARVHKLKVGGVLFAAGDAGDGCYRLDEGLLKVMVTSRGGEERTVAVLGPGAVVGELAMTDRMPRSASVKALRDSVLRFDSLAGGRTRNACAQIVSRSEPSG